MLGGLPTEQLIVNNKSPDNRFLYKNWRIL